MVFSQAFSARFVAQASSPVGTDTPLRYTQRREQRNLWTAYSSKPRAGLRPHGSPRPHSCHWRSYAGAALWHAPATAGTCGGIGRVAPEPWLHLSDDETDGYETPCRNIRAA